MTQGTRGNVPSVGARPLRKIALTLAALCALAEPAEAATLTWSAPPGCPDEAEVHDHLVRELGAKLDAASKVRFEAVATKQGAGFQLDLTTREGGALHERRIQAKNCDDLLEAMVVAVSLALQTVTESTEPTTRFDEAPPSETAPPESTTPAPRARAPVEAPPRARPHDQQVHALGGVAAVIDVGAFPQPGFGAEGFLGIRVSDFKLLGSGGFFPEQRATLVGSAQARFTLSLGGASFCYVPATPIWQLGACLGGELGSLSAIGANVRNPRATSSLWAAANATGWLTVRPRGTGWGVFFSPGVVVPLRRPQFVLTELGLVHQPASLGFRGLAGLELELR
jgi:hypothetical protein